MVASNAYLLLGPNTQGKEERIKAIRKEFLSDKFKDFNTDIFFADDLKPQVLCESLIRLPVKSLKRLVVIKNVEKLSAKNQEIISSFLKKSHPSLVLVLETPSGIIEKTHFLQSLKNLCNVYDTTTPLVNTFSLARLVDSRRTQEALGVLAKLFNQGERPERILGGLRFHWSQQDKASLYKRPRLKLLLEADRAIKTSSLKDNLALELMVVKLCRL